jgi:hypothetical protein
MIKNFQFALYLSAIKLTQAIVLNPDDCAKISEPEDRLKEDIDVGEANGSEVVVNVT